MKNLTYLFFLICFSCQTSTPVSNTVSDGSQRDALTGAWQMTNYLRVTNDGDSITDARLQYKMYIDGSVMWGFEAAPDSTEWFGYGSYFIEGDSLFETMASGSYAFRQAIQGQNNFFRIALTVSDNMYTQVISENEATVYESYQRVMN